MPFPRSRQAEVLPVPQAKIALLWKYAARYLRKIPNYDLDHQRVRLLSGQDTLWLAVLTVGKSRQLDLYIGAIITTVSDRPPCNYRRKAFRRKDLALYRSLKVHMVGETPGCWIDSAAERITAYGKQQKCRMLFVLAKMRWRGYATRLWLPDWELAGYSRDRPTKGRGSHYPGWNKVGNYRIMQPIDRKMRKQDYNSGTMCYFPERAA